MASWLKMKHLLKTPENIVTKAIVVKLGLKMGRHLSPYKIWWIKRGPEIQVTGTCHVPFSIGKIYTDVVLRDVVDMDTCHMI